MVERWEIKRQMKNEEERIGKEIYIRFNKERKREAKNNKKNNKRKKKKGKKVKVGYIKMRLV